MASSAITVRILGDSKGVRRAVSDSESSLDRFGKTAGRVSRNAAKAFAVMGAAAVGAGAIILKSSVTAASDLNETVSKTEAILGSASGAVIEWSKTTADAMGVSQREALDMASAYSGALKNIGNVSEEEAAKTAQSLTTLTADLGSFFNQSNESVQAAISSALTGEFEPLKKFNVIINESILKQKALELGVYDGTGALDAQAKQMATLALITEQTADAQGDFERTSGSLANQQKRLGAQVEDLKARIGGALLPVIQKALGYLLDNLPAIQAAGEQAFNRLMEVVEPVRPMFEALVAHIVENWPKIQETIVNVMTVIGEIIAEVVALVSAIWQKWGDELLRVIQAVWPIIAAIITTTLGVIRDVIKTVTALIKGDWDGVWAGIKSIVAGVWLGIQSIVSGSLNLLKETISIALGGLVELFKGMPGRIVRGLGDLSKLLYNVGIDIINGLWKGLKDRWDDVARWISKLNLGPLGSLAGAVGGVFDNAPSGGGTFDRMHDGGYVQGKLGTEQLIVAQAGEYVTPIGGRRPGTSITINKVEVYDGRDLFDELDRRAALV